ncbi:MAG: ABC transporter ATP-binding protein, partial [Promethearchaeota archaeon]
MLRNLLEISKIYHYYEKARALEEINLTIEEGSLDAVIGPNGAGKTTLLRVITKLEEPDRGKIFFMGERIDELEPYQIAAKGVIHCPERRRLFYDMNVLENLEMGAYKLKDKDKKEELLDLVFEIFPRLEERQKQRSGTLSGGEQQMLAIGRSLMGDPKLLLMDEPSLGLAPKVKGKIFEAIQQIRNEGKTILLVEQDATVTMEIA